MAGRWSLAVIFEDRIIRLEQLLRYLPQEKVAKIDLRYGKGAAISWRTGR